MPELNEPLFRKIADVIEAEPHRWNQSLWASWIMPHGFFHTVLADKSVCGTAFCVAGWAIELTLGHEVESGSLGLKRLLPIGESIDACVHELASDVLGLAEKQADILFSAASFNNGTDVEGCVSVLRDLADGHPFDDTIVARIRAV